MINIVSFSNVQIDDENVGDCLSAIANYPNQAGAILAALFDYEQRLIASAIPTPEPTINPEIIQLQQQISLLQAQLDAQAPNIDLSEISLALTQSSFDEWLLPLMQQPQTMRSAFRLISALDSGDIAGVRSAYHTIAAVAPPTTGQLEEWQAVLDNLSVPPEVMRFVD